MSHFQRSLVLAAALSLSLAAAGCTSGLLQSHVPPVQQYLLHATPAAQGATPPAAGTRPSLRVLQPMPAPGLDTDRIALLQAGNRMDYYAGSRWNGQLPEVVGNLGVETLRGTGAWSTVVDSRTLLTSDYQLQIGIGHFEADYSSLGGSGNGMGGGGAAPVVNVSLQCLLTRRADGSVVASFTAAAQQQAGENRMGSVVAAFEAALNKALADAAARAADAVR